MQTGNWWSLAVTVDITPQYDYFGFWIAPYQRMPEHWKKGV
jgi:hypothetical protein